MGIMGFIQMLSILKRHVFVCTYTISSTLLSAVWFHKNGGRRGGGGFRDKIDLRDRSLGSALECVYTRGQPVGL